MISRNFFPFCTVAAYPQNKVSSADQQRYENLKNSQRFLGRHFLTKGHWQWTVAIDMMIKAATRWFAILQVFQNAVYLYFAVLLVPVLCVIQPRFSPTDWIGNETKQKTSKRHNLLPFLNKPLFVAQRIWLDKINPCI